MLTNKLNSRVFPVLLNLTLALTLLIGSAAFPARAHAASTITVATNADEINSNGLCSLREAITNANGDNQTYTDCVIGSGDDTIQFNDALGTTTITLGSTLPDLLDPDGLTINGGGDITISGNNLYRIFIAYSGSLTLNNLTLANGKVVSALGGAISANQISLIINESTFSGNSAVLGGGIYIEDGTLDITNSSFSGNSALYGGGIASAGSTLLTITNSIFSTNVASDGGGGGGVYSAGTMTITKSTFTDNIGGRGSIGNYGTATITNSTFSGNSTSGTGGAGDIYQLGTSSTLNLYNNILANNGGGGHCMIENGTVSGNNNLIEDLSTACGFTNGVNGNITGSDPNLGLMTGSPAYFPLNIGSPAIDAGNDTVCATTPVSNTSQNGVARPQGTHCDIGAYELDNIAPTVSSIVRAHLNPTTAVSVDFTVTFSEPVTGVNLADFTLASSGVTGASITSVTPVSGTTYTVTVNTGTGSGTLRLDMPVSATINDLSGNPLATLPYTSGASYIVDKTAPTVFSNLRVNSSPTAASNVDFTVTFSEPVTGVDLADFTLISSGVTGASITSVTPVSGTTYTVTVNTGTGNGIIRLDVLDDNTIVDAALNPLAAGFTGGETYTINKSAIFADVPFSYWANSYIERLFNAGVTGGCSTVPLNYCPDSTVTRAQMAVFLLKGIHGSSYTPPTVGGSTGFNDVATSYWAAAWIKQLAAEGITSGCGTNVYCPDAPVTRAQMAVFLLKAKYGSTYAPPAVGGSTGFNDVATNYWAATFIKQLAAEGVTSGCGPNVYCPENSVTRAEMAVFLVKTFNLP